MHSEEAGLDPLAGNVTTIAPPRNAKNSKLWRAELKLCGGAEKKERSIRPVFGPLADRHAWSAIEADGLRGLLLTLS
jgi:hypothetical protein